MTGTLSSLFMPGPIPPKIDLDYYSYDLPQGLIAQHPPRNRNGARLLYIGQEGKIEDSLIKKLDSYLKRGDVLVLNNSRVLPLRLFGNKQDTNNNKIGGKVELLITKIKSEHQAEALIKASGAPKPGSHIILDKDPNTYLQIISSSNGIYLLRCAAEKNITMICEQFGATPLPPYIKRGVNSTDKLRYQTVYAKESGSAAAPTAGLHFTNNLLKKLSDQGVHICELTLHVGIGTFTPIRSRDIRKHKMHPEYCRLSKATSDKLNQAKAKGRRIIAVGTTSLRALETFFDSTGGTFRPGAKDTSIFIYPGGQKIKSADILLTNFHQPASSLLLLICAFGGYENIMKGYKHAVDKGYKFLSYGDACLINRHN